MRWENNFRALCEYGKIHGSCNVPRDQLASIIVSVREDGLVVEQEQILRIGNWLHKQRSNCKHGKLAPYKMQKLNELVEAGLLQWAIRDSTVAKWDRCFVALKAHSDAIRDKRISNSDNITLDDGTLMKIGQWLKKQRSNAKRGLLSAERANQLAELAESGKLNWIAAAAIQSSSKPLAPTTATTTATATATATTTAGAKAGGPFTTQVVPGVKEKATERESVALVVDKDKDDSSSSSPPPSSSSSSADAGSKRTCARDGSEPDQAKRVGTENDMDPSFDTTQQQRMVLDKLLAKPTVDVNTIPAKVEVEEEDEEEGDEDDDEEQELQDEIWKSKQFMKTCVDEGSSNNNNKLVLSSGGDTEKGAKAIAALHASAAATADAAVANVAALMALAEYIESESSSGSDSDGVRRIKQHALKVQMQWEQIKELQAQLPNANSLSAVASEEVGEEVGANGERTMQLSSAPLATHVHGTSSSSSSSSSSASISISISIGSNR